jgi:hypothetical protein
LKPSVFWRAWQRTSKLPVRHHVSSTTNAEGVFTATGVIPGDSYRVTPESGRPVTVTPSVDGEDMGVVTVTNGVNFKTAIAPVQNERDETLFDMNTLYMNQTYAFDLTFTNVGTEDCPAPSYTITAPAGVSVTGDARVYSARLSRVSGRAFQ